jgi:hypothetical protein
MRVGKYVFNKVVVAMSSGDVRMYGAVSRRPKALTVCFVEGVQPNMHPSLLIRGQQPCVNAAVFFHSHILSIKGINTGTQF